DHLRVPQSYPTRRSSDLRTSFLTHEFAPQIAFVQAHILPMRRPSGIEEPNLAFKMWWNHRAYVGLHGRLVGLSRQGGRGDRHKRSEEHTSELQSLRHLVC